MDSSLVLQMIGIPLLINIIFSFLGMDNWYQKAVAVTFIICVVLNCVLLLIADFTGNVMILLLVICGASVACVIQSRSDGMTSTHKALLLTTILIMLTAFVKMHIMT